jgi:hypothetical protein
VHLVGFNTGLFTIVISVICFNPINPFAHAKLQQVDSFKDSETFMLAIEITTMQLNAYKMIYKTNKKRVNSFGARD